MTTRREYPDGALWRLAVEGFNRIVLDDASKLAMNSTPESSVNKSTRIRFWKEVADVYDIFLVGYCGRALPSNNLATSMHEDDEALEMTVLNVLGDKILDFPIDASTDVSFLVSQCNRQIVIP